jgi:hypothetical protein
VPTATCPLSTDTDEVAVIADAPQSPHE